MIFGERGNVTTPSFSPSICHEVMQPDAMILVFLVFSFKLALSLSYFTLIKRLLSSSLLSATRVLLDIIRISEVVVSPTYLDYGL